MARNSTSSVARFRRHLLGWYDDNRRDLPWRKDRDPYRVWLSEIMLQQTTVEAVRPHYLQFLERFPDLEALARASENEVLEHWSGLGYYRRARLLHHAARQLVEDLGGRFPRRAEELARLPGFGPYTSAAVASIVFDQVIPVVDGNVIRVVARLAALPGHPRQGPLVRAVQDLAAAWVDPHRPGDFNQAMMELGATVCRPRSPRCTACPVSSGCQAQKLGRQESIPAPSPSRALTPVRLASGVLVEGNAVLLRRRRDTPFLDGLLETPSTDLDDGEAAEPKLKALFRALGYRQLRLAAVAGPVRQVITSRRVEVEVFTVTGRPSPRGVREDDDLQLRPITDLALPALFRKVVTAALG